MRIPSHINKLIFEKRIFHLITGSRVTVEKGGLLQIGKNIKIKKSKIYVQKGDKLIIGDNTAICNTSISMITGKENQLYIGKHCRIQDYNIGLTNGNVTIGDNNILQKGGAVVKPSFTVEDGRLIIGSYNRLRCSIWIRFKGKVAIGSRNAINEGTEIRCDHEVKIGDYNQISYNCTIWDTNTHNLYKAEERRRITDEQYPDFGLEFEKPKTSPVNIGNDCWIGRNASILKGGMLADKCIVGYGTLITNFSAPKNSTIINEPVIKIIKNQL